MSQIIIIEIFLSSKSMNIILPVVRKTIGQNKIMDIIFRNVRCIKIIKFDSDFVTILGWLTAPSAYVWNCDYWFTSLYCIVLDQLYLCQQKGIEIV